MSRNNENKLIKFLFNQGAFFLAVASMIVGITLFITRPDAQFHEDISLIKQEVHLMKTNDLTHIEKSLINVDQKLTDIENRFDKIEQILIRLEEKSQ